jgi:hypothetical protein
MMDHLAQHPPQTREELVAYAAYTLADTPDSLDHWITTPAARDAISALLADLNAKRQRDARAGVRLRRGDATRR